MTDSLLKVSIPHLSTSQCWQHVFEQSAIGIAIVAFEDNTFYRVNRSFARQRQYEPEELEGKPVTIVYPADQLNNLQNALEDLSTTGHNVYLIEHLRKDGSRFPVSVDLTAVMDPQGNVVGRIAFAQDISERVEFERRISEERNRLKLAQEAAHFGSFDWDCQTNHLVWSGEMQRLYGFESGEFDGRFETWRDSILPEHRDIELQNAALAMETGIVNRQFPIRRRNDGEVRWLEARGTVIFDESHKPLKMIGINIDITERMHAEVALIALNATLEEKVKARTAELETLVKELEAFSYSVSHDLRAPLRGIDGWSLALLEDYGDKLDDKGKTYLRTVREEAHEMGQLIDALLKLSRVVRVPLTITEVDISALAEKLAAKVRARNAGRNFQFQIAAGLVAHGDSRLLEVVLHNLFENAAKFTAAQPVAVIAIGQRQIDGESAFFVTDNGVGFDMAYASNLFAPFQRLHRKSEYPGAGIGLATIQRIVHRHNGRCWAESKLGLGATVFFTLGEVL